MKHECLMNRILFIKKIVLLQILLFIRHSSQTYRCNVNTRTHKCLPSNFNVTTLYRNVCRAEKENRKTGMHNMTRKDGMLKIISKKNQSTCTDIAGAISQF